MKSMNFTLKSKLVAGFIALMLSAPSVFATDGYFGVGYDTKSIGMGGAGVALFQNSFFGINNPASLVMHGNKYGLNLGVFNPNREYTVTGNPSGYPGTFGLAPGTVESDSKYFPMPSLALNRMINEKSSIGLSLYGNGGMNTNYPTNTFWGTSETTGVNLMQMFGALSYSHKIGQKWSVGLSAILAWQSVEITGLQAFSTMSQDATKLTDNGANSALGLGGKVGIQGEIAKGLFFGATFQSRIYMNEFEDYSGLFAESGSFDIPANWTAGLAYMLIPNKLTVAFDVKQIYYSKVNSIGNPMNFMAPMGSETGSGFGWNDMTIYKFGLEYAANEDWTLRTGFSYGDNPIRSTDVMFNILAPGVIDNHLTFGFSKKMGTKELNVALVRAFSNTVSGPNPMEAPDTQTIDISMNQWELQIGITF